MSHTPSSDVAIPALPAYNGDMRSHPDRPAIAVIGAGPRGTSLIERIGANLGDPSSALHGIGLDLHVIDDAESGAGRIWRTDQTRELCMNTLSHAVTLFTEPSSTVAGPVRPGPTLYEWSLLTLHDSFPAPWLTERLAAIPAEHQASYAAHPARTGLAAAYRNELEQTVPESHPSRALYGEYLAWCYERAVAELPETARVIRHRSRAVGIHRENGGDRISLSDGVEIVVDAVILATGWMDREVSEWERDLAAHLSAHPNLTWVPPASPVDQHLDDVPAGSPAIVRGFGMGFFDTMALLTIGRGGVFHTDPHTDSGLRYEPSGQEPVLHVTSRRGVPFRSKTLYGSLPPKPRQHFVRSVDWSAATHPIDFDTQFWPRAVADAHLAYLETLARVRPEAVVGSLTEATDALERAVQTLTDEPGPAELRNAAVRLSEVMAPFVPDPADRFDLVAELRPADRKFASPEEYHAWIRRRIVDDLREAELGHDSALKAGLWSLSVARDAANKAGSLGGFDAESRISGFALLHAIGGLAGSGPPAFRNRQLVALMDAGLVRLIGPAAPVEFDTQGFSAQSPGVPGSDVTAHTLIDAWMHFHDVAESADPLTHDLLEAGRARPFRITSRDGSTVATRAFDVEPLSGRLIGADGSADATVHIAGIPVDDALHGTIISPMPGTDPPMLRETDRVARSVIEVVAARTTATRSSPAAITRRSGGAQHV